VTIGIQTTVLPDNRIDVAAPELGEGEQVDAVINPPNGDIGMAAQQLRTFLESPLPNRRTESGWKKVDRRFHAERESWE